MRQHVASRRAPPAEQPVGEETRRTSRIGFSLDAAGRATTFVHRSIMQPKLAAASPRAPAAAPAFGPLSSLHSCARATLLDCNPNGMARNIWPAAAAGRRGQTLGWRVRAASARAAHGRPSSSRARAVEVQATLASGGRRCARAARAAAGSDRLGSAAAASFYGPTLPLAKPVKLPRTAGWLLAT